MAAIALSLSAALCWGFSDFAAGMKSRRLGVLSVLLWVEGAGLAVVLVVIAGSGEPLPDGRTLLYSAVAGIAGLTGLGAFYRALAVGTMSIVAPVSAAGVTVPVLVGLVSGDSLGTVVAAGLVVTFLGVLVVSRSVDDRGASAPAGHSAVVLALLAAAGFGTYFAFADVAADGSVLWLLAVGRLTVIPFVALLVRRSGARLFPAGREPLVLAAIGVVDLSATALYALATTRGELSIVAVLGSLYPVATVVLARLVLGERLSRRQAAGVVAALVGVAMVSAG